MTTHLDHAGVPSPRGGHLRRGWSLATAGLAGALIVEAGFAGAMLSGADWARQAHRATAGLLVCATLAASLLAYLSLRRRPRGARLGLLLLALAGGLVLQAGVGAFIARHGANLQWLHVPLGVALLGLAGQARRQLASFPEGEPARAGVLRSHL